ncbi:MAG: anthranilate synthase component I family protein [Kofleriaceae bacterium]
MTESGELPPDPLAACARLRGLRGRALLHSARDDDELGAASFVAAAPRDTLIARGRSLLRLDPQGRPARRWSGDPVDAIADFLEEHGAGLAAPEDDEPRPRVLGYLGYDLARAIEALDRGPALGDDCPEVWLGAYDAIVRYDARGPRLLGAAPARAQLAESLQHGPPSPALAPRFGPLVADDSGDHHRARVERVLEYLAAGDVYQVNLARRHVARQRAPGDALALYAALARRSPAPYGGLLETDSVTLLSSSPERFLHLHAGKLETRPIKGTRPRLHDEPRDLAAARDLAEAEKDGAEHLMIVDLERNDLGRVAEGGTVTVDALGYVVEFATVLHRVSRISAKLAAGVDHRALLRATFPGGSITGAPKVRAMQLIDELEVARRGPYCGAFGYFGAGHLDLALSIRVGVLTSSELRLHVGGGIVADSDPAAELVETEDKLAGWRRALADIDAG